jgi:hypothetical protein
LVEFQNDGLGADDVFLWNSLFNGSILGSRRAAATAIPGNGPSTTPALSGVGHHLAFQSVASDLVLGDSNGVQDAFYLAAQGNDRIEILTVTSVDGQNTVEWLTPAVNYVATHLYANEGANCPVNSTTDSGVVNLTLDPGFVEPGPNGKGLFVHDVGTSNNDKNYCYGAFIETDAGPLTTTPKQGSGTPFDTSGKVKWRFNTGAAALVAPGLNRLALYVTSNDKGLYAVQAGSGAGSGTWLPGYWPLRFPEPIQGRPPVVPVSVSGSAETVFVGDQPTTGGHVYAVDANLGARAGGALWRSLPLGEGIQGSVGGVFMAFGGPANFLFAGTRNASTGGFFALNLADGTQAGTFSSGGNMGPILAGPAVAYGTPTSKVYFASRTGVSSSTLWCLDVTAGGFSALCGQAAIGNVDSAPSLRAGRVYVGGNDGRIHAFTSDLSAEHWTAIQPSTNPTRGYVALDRQGSANDFFFVQGLQVFGYTDNGTFVSPKMGFPVTTLMNPSFPVFTRVGGVPYLYVGTTTGDLCQIKTDDPQGPGGILCQQLQAANPLGPPSLDATNDMIYIGGSNGVVYAVSIPFP